jgi:hypothetical protein
MLMKITAFDHLLLRVVAAENRSSTSPPGE